ncbi:T9SS type A sorting domain-containing protein [Telluribacter humicola]|uniref:T9SS type A sorting domain-containing protein n=1 Tax=Telluribacter humicola TaxID=1720261 RepID=UPI001E3F1B9A|nr:T9SS type A sorting domain-containing protein [Telluribacter humicola]
MYQRFLLFIVILLVHQRALSQVCEPAFKLSPVTPNNTIEWSKFPEFSLPFTIIYEGPRFGDTQSQPLKHGFSHLSSLSGAEPSTLPVQNRALLWNSVATVDNKQPWSIFGLESPWGNDTTLYRNYWNNYLEFLANRFDNSRGTGLPKADIICLDVERMQEEDRDILRLKTDRRVPEPYLSLSDTEFLRTYKQDIRWWYSEAVRHLKRKGLDPSTKITSYSDVPVRGTWLNITANSWQDWATNPLRTHYLMNDNSGKVGGQFYEQMDLLTPSAYYFYPYSNPLGKDYLSYLLFQIEVNRAWSDKPIVPFVWLRYHTSFSPDANQIPDFMAQATAIFPFFSGAKGLWLWDSNQYERNRQENYATYEHFIYGLYRLSEYADMFQGNYELVIPQSARDHMELRNPIWRGVVKGDRILIAAQNTYATENQDTEITVAYRNWYKTITLKGREVFLCSFDLKDVIASDETYLADARLYPNPTSEQAYMILTGVGGGEVDFTLTDVRGTVILESKYRVLPGDSRYELHLPGLAPGVYIARIAGKDKVLTRRLVIAK